MASPQTEPLPAAGAMRTHVHSPSETTSSIPKSESPPTSQPSRHQPTPKWPVQKSSRCDIPIPPPSQSGAREYTRWSHHDEPPPRFPPSSNFKLPLYSGIPDKPSSPFATKEWRRHRRFSSPSSSSATSARSDSDSDYSPNEWPTKLPRWVRQAKRNPPIVTRKVKRWILLGIALLTLTLAAHVQWTGPARAEHRASNPSSDVANPRAARGRKPTNGANMKIGSNMAIDFAGMTQVKKLDLHHLPGNAGGRLVFVGDIHGCKHELLKLLEKIDFRHKRDHLVTAGDMIGKGPDSRGVVDALIGLNASCVRGNHEDRVLLARADIKAKPSRWKSVEEEEDFERETMSGGEARARHTARLLSDRQADWLAACPVILRVGRVPGVGRLVVAHAGLVPGVRLRRQDPFQVMNMRSMDPITRMPSEKRDGTEWYKVWTRWQKKLPHSQRATVVYGHDSKKGLNIKRWVKGLDTGCVNGDSLTAWIVGEDRQQHTVSVKCRKDN